MLTREQIEKVSRLERQVANGRPELMVYEFRLAKKKKLTMKKASKSKKKGIRKKS